MNNIFPKILFSLLFIQSAFLFGQLPELTLQTGHTDQITTLVFSSDGRYLASAGKDNIIIIWDFNLGKQIKRLTGHTGTINCMKFFDSDRMLATGGNDGKILIWDLISESVIKSMPQVKSAQIVSLDISPGSSYLIFCGNPFYLGKWDLQTNELSDGTDFFSKSPVFHELQSDNSDYTRIGFSGEGNNMYIMKTGSVYYFNPTNPSADRFYKGKERKSFISFITLSRQKNHSSIKYIWIDENGNDIIFSDIRSHKKMTSGFRTGNSTVVRWNMVHNKRVFARSSEYIKYNFTCGTVNVDKTMIAAGNEDNSIYLWDFTTGKSYSRFSGSSSVSTILFHPVKKNILVSCDSGRDISIWDIAEKKILRKLSSTNFPITAIAVNNEENIITMAGTDNSIKVLNIKDNVDLRSINDNESNISGLGFTSSGNGIVSVGLDNRIKFWNLNADKLDLSLKGNANPALLNALLHLPILSLYANTFTSYFFTKSFVLKDIETLKAVDISNDNRYTAAGGTGFRSGYFYRILAPRMLPIHIIDNQAQKLDQKFQGHYVSVDALAFNSSGSLLASAGHDYKMTGKTLLEKEKRIMGESAVTNNKSYNEINSLKIWDIKTKRLSAAFENQSPIRSLAFERSSDSMLFADDEKNIVMFDYKTIIASKLERGTGPLLFQTDDKSFFFQDQGYSMNQFNLSADSVIRKFSGHSDKITSALLIQNGKRLITAGWDGSLKLWDVEKGSEILTFYALNQIDFLLKTPDNYYFATKNAVSEIGFTFGMKFYPFEQFDLKYNRPDIVLEKLGNTSPELIAAYYRAYQKRINKLGFTEDMLSEDFHLPEVEISNIKSIEQVTSNKELTMKIVASDTKYKLDRINVWINDVALYGKVGIDKRSFDSQSSTDDIKIQLAAGVNKIQVSVLNQKGAESLKEIVEVNYNAPPFKPDLYLISIGVSKYLDARFDLNYASKDASDISQLFKTDTSLYRNIYVKTLIDNQVTSSILKELRTFFEKAKRDDVVMLFVAGHGLLDSNLDYYFGTYDMNFDDPAVKGIVYDNIEALFDGLSSLKKILFMDTCFSGEVDKDEMELAQATTTEFGDVTFRSAGAGVRMKEAFGMNNTSEIMKELFTDIRKGTGSTVISSAGGAEFAMEGDQWKNGLFTFCVLNGINKRAADINNDGKIMLSELQDYIRTNVSKLSEGKQSPTSRIQNISMDFRIW